MYSHSGEPSVCGRYRATGVVTASQVKLKGDTMAFQVYVGANNKTGKLETNIVERVCNKRHQGYTIQPATGYWNGKREKSAVIIIEDTKDRVLSTVRDLKKQLNQEAVAYQEVNKLEFV